MRVIWCKGDFRIVEVADDFSTMEELLGDSFNPKVHPELPIEQLKVEEREERETISRQGVYGYHLEYWNPEINRGWEDVDSCYGFVGAYSKGHGRFDHYIVDEMQQMAAKHNKKGV